MHRETKLIKYLTVHVGVEASVHVAKLDFSSFKFSLSSAFHYPELKRTFFVKFYRQTSSAWGLLRKASSSEIFRCNGFAINLFINFEFRHQNLKG